METKVRAAAELNRRCLETRRRREDEVAPSTIEHLLVYDDEHRRRPEETSPRRSTRRPSAAWNETANETTTTGSDRRYRPRVLFLANADGEQLRTMVIEHWSSSENDHDVFEPREEYENNTAGLVGNVGGLPVVLTAGRLGIVDLLLRFSLRLSTSNDGEDEEEGSTSNFYNKVVPLTIFLCAFCSCCCRLLNRLSCCDHDDERAAFSTDLGRIRRQGTTKKKRCGLPFLTWPSSWPASHDPSYDDEEASVTEVIGDPTLSGRTKRRPATNRCWNEPYLASNPPCGTTTTTL